MQSQSDVLNAILDEVATWRQPEQVVALLTLLADLHPELTEMPLTFEVLGAAHGDLGDRALAAVTYEKALRLDPTRTTASAGYEEVRDLRDVNYDEARVPDYQLPDPLTLADGRPVTDAETWWRQDRAGS